MQYFKSQEADSILKYDKDTNDGVIAFIDINPETGASTGITIMQLSSYTDDDINGFLASYMESDESEYLQHRDNKFKDYWNML